MQCCLLACSPWPFRLLLYTSQDHLPMCSAAHCGLGLPHQLAMMKTPHRHAHRPIRQKGAFNQGSLFQGDFVSSWWELTSSVENFVTEENKETSEWPTSIDLQYLTWRLNHRKFGLAVAQWLRKLVLADDRDLFPSNYMAVHKWSVIPVTIPFSDHHRHWA